MSPFLLQLLRNLMIVTKYWPKIRSSTRYCTVLIHLLSDPGWYIYIYIYIFVLITNILFKDVTLSYCQLFITNLKATLRVYMHVRMCVRVCVCMCVSECVRTYVPVCVCACVRACVRVWTVSLRNCPASICLDYNRRCGETNQWLVGYIPELREISRSGSAEVPLNEM